MASSTFDAITFSVGGLFLSSTPQLRHTIQSRINSGNHVCRRTVQRYPSTSMMIVLIRDQRGWSINSLWLAISGSESLAHKRSTVKRKV